ncbi:transglutaminase-like domain-containing protein [Streptomyces sp. AK08-02]|uniref:transglutaminase-like domain-containing protein n=1 Tax=Streptomyces sp. AK08-02 TaxID=3028654 RepID=UPI0029B4747D|nr:transglutaminase-like domain-containing protein [Streptomyces sp. AK08-02]MDX3747897.1 transglutaminase-like domain-containing protein [Streptomyces sp. AK08-02]
MPSAHPSLTPEAAAFYRAQSTFSDPGDLARLYAGLPADPARLARTARDLMIHRVEGDLFRHTHPADRLHHDADTRYVDDILRIVIARDGSPLTRRRAAGDRFVGVCRDFALLHCSLLRHSGVPARVRSGFADYFEADSFHYDHVVTEYWDETRGWLLADAQLADPEVTAAWYVDFDPMDVPRDRFLVAGRAWRDIRAGDADPDTFGLYPPEDGPLNGEWFVAGNVRLDLAALNKVETLLWDIWGTEGEDDGRSMTEPVRELYDRVAALVAPDSPGDVSFDAVRRIFAEEDGVRTPETVLRLSEYNPPRHVTLRPF